MSRKRGWKWAVLALAVAMVFSLGCAKKQAVKSEPPPPAPGAKEAPGGIKAEEMKPETKAPAAESRVAASEAAGAELTKEQASLFQDIRFDFDKSFIRDDAKPTLAKVAEYLKNNKGAKIQIEGHCDERGTSEYNMALGDRRANAARKYLESLGVASGSLSTISFGKEKPLDPGHDEDAWAKNRRDHFVLK